MNTKISKHFINEGKNYQPHFNGEEEVCLGSHSKLVAQAGIKASPPGSQFCALRH